MTLPLFEAQTRQALGPGAWLLHGFALPDAVALLDGVDVVIAGAPLRNMLTPGGRAMSVAMTNCGALGWTSDRSGYRYVPQDPQRGLPWPAMPAAFSELAGRAAQAAGFADFSPDACLINRYSAGHKLSLHQDKDEHDFGQPIVSVSLGIAAVFLFGGLARQDRALRLTVVHGDVLVWGGASRMNYHGVAALSADRHALTQDYRFNLTFRKAG